MKHGGGILVCFAIMAVFCAFPLMAQEYNKNYQTYLVDSFDTADGAEWEWVARGSKFITDGYPILQMFDGMPRTLRVMYSEEDSSSKQYLGVQAKFKRMGDNWFDIVPSVDGEPYEIPFKGEISRLDMWVWGADYLYELEILLRDVEGRVHTIPVGWLNFKGWKNMGVSIPTSIKQTTKYLGTDAKLKFVCFRIRTNPNERVDDFRFFIDEFKALTDVFVDSYDGYELVDTVFGGK